MVLVAGLLWKGFETYSQISLRNMASVSADWVRLMCSLQLKYHRVFLPLIPHP